MNGPYDNAEPDILVPISALEHFSYCPRQCALIHVEQTFDENVFTVRGRLSHERPDLGITTTSRGVKQLRSLPLYSDGYGLIGKADVVELHENGPLPIEYKVGHMSSKHASIQLCAQALCLEEMFRVDVAFGVLYSYSAKHRVRVAIDQDLRRQTHAAVVAVRKLINKQELPPPVNDSRCPDCSLLNACLPALVTETPRVRGYQGALFVPAKDEDTDGWFDV